jgi:hypothetical protein
MKLRIARTGGVLLTRTGRIIFRYDSATMALRGKQEYPTAASAKEAMGGMV